MMLPIQTRLKTVEDLTKKPDQKSVSSSESSSLIPLGNDASKKIIVQVQVHQPAHVELQKEEIVPQAIISRENIIDQVPQLEEIEVLLEKDTAVSAEKPKEIDVLLENQEVILKEKKKEITKVNCNNNNHIMIIINTMQRKLNKDISLFNFLCIVFTLSTISSNK